MCLKAVRLVDEKVRFTTKHTYGPPQDIFEVIAYAQMSNKARGLILL